MNTNTKRFINNSNTNTNHLNNLNTNRVNLLSSSSSSSSFKENNWPESQFQQNSNKQQFYKHNNNNKFHTVRGQNRHFKGNNLINYNRLNSEQRGNNMENTNCANGSNNYDLNEHNKIEMMNESVATVPIDQNNLNSKMNNLKTSFVPSLSVEHSINDSSLQSDDSIVNGGHDACESALSASPHKINEHNSDELACNPDYDTIKGDHNNSNECGAVIPIVVNQGPIIDPQTQHQYGYSPYYNSQAQLIEIPPNDRPALAEISCNTSGVYTNGVYEYDYAGNMAHNHPQLIHPQGSPYYVWQPTYQPYPEYAPVGAANGAPVALAVPTNGSPIQNNQNSASPQQAQAYYAAPAYPPPASVPYLYDPNMGAYANMVNVTYSPVQNHQQLMSSPQQQSTMLSSYQTPPQPQHQLYMTPSSMTPPTTLSSPNDSTPNTTLHNNSITGNQNDHVSNMCNSPSTGNNLMQNQQQLAQSNPNISPSNPQIFTNPYLIYPPGTNPYLTPQQTYQCQSPIPTPYMMSTMYPPPPLPANQTTPTGIPNMMSPQSNQFNKYNNNKYNKYNKYNNKRNQKYNNNQNNNQNNHNNLQNSNNIQTPQQQEQSYEDIANEETTLNDLTLQNSALYPSHNSICSPQQMNNGGYEFCDPNGMMNPGGVIPYNYDMFNHYANYVDEYGCENYDDNETQENENDEQLACYVCRGRRMCFCYFLKVRYYKFPSFFDLVDHTYKKLRSQNQMYKPKKA